MKITLGIVNYNRLFYLKSCIKSILETANINNFQLICVDGGSTENGTKEYLKEIESYGFQVIHQSKYSKISPSKNFDNVSHINPFSESLNIIYKESKNPIILPLQGDQQFVRKNWDQELINLFLNKNDIGCICIDSMRRIRLSSSLWNKINCNEFDYFYSNNSFVPGAGDVAYSKILLDKLNGWQIGLNVNSEDDFVSRSQQLGIQNYKRYYLSIPACVCIYTDPSGTNCRIRGGRRFGSYWQAKDDLYYKYKEINHNPYLHPVPIEDMAVANGGWQLPINPDGSFKKNPLPISENTESSQI